MIKFYTKRALQFSEALKTVIELKSIFAYLDKKAQAKLDEKS